MRLAILGAGNIGVAIAEGLVAAGTLPADAIVLTRCRVELLEPLQKRGYRVAANNREAVRGSETVLVAVEPQQIDGVLREIASDLKPKSHILMGSLYRKSGSE